MNDKNKILLILRAQSGDKKAYNELLISIQKELYGYIWNVLSDKSMAEDILQEVFIIVYRKLPLLKEPEFFRAWLCKITTREIFRIIKKKKMIIEDRIDAEELENLTQPAESFKLSEIVIEKLYSLINDLTPFSKAVLTLHYNNGIAIGEIADILGIPVGTVKSRLSYGLSIIKRKAQSDVLLKEELGIE